MKEKPIKFQGHPIYLKKKIDNYEINLSLSEEENLKLYEKSLGEKTSWYNFPFTVLPYSTKDTTGLGDELGCITAPIFIAIFLLCLALLAIYLPFWFILRSWFGRAEKSAHNRKIRIAENLIREYYQSYEVQLEYGILSTNNALRSEEQELNRLKPEYEAYLKEINSKPEKIRSKYGATIKSRISVAEDKLKAQEKMINLLTENLQELQILRADLHFGKKMIGEGKEGGKMLQKANSLVRHDLLLQRLEDIKKMRSFSEQMAEFDNTEIVGLVLKELEKIEIERSAY